jgi:hypothetical protein
MVEAADEHHRLVPYLKRTAGMAADSAWSRMAGMQQQRNPEIDFREIFRVVRFSTDGADQSSRSAGLPQQRPASRRGGFAAGPRLDEADLGSGKGLLRKQAAGRRAGIRSGATLAAGLEQCGRFRLGAHEAPEAEL